MLLERLRRLLNRETLPEYFSGVSIERQEAAAESAAFVFGVASGGLCERRDRHVETVAIKEWRAGDAGKEMVLDLRLPEQLACVSVQRLDVRFLVAEIDRVFGLRLGWQRADADGGAHSRARLHCPIGTARLRVQGDYHSGFDGQVEAIADDRRLARRHRSRMRPRPFDLQLRNVFGLDPRIRLEA